MEETSRVSGYGPTREGWQMSWRGACGERVGVEISYAGRPEVDEVLGKALAYARDMVPHLLTRCGEINTIEASVHGRPQNPPRFYRFVMRRQGDWQPTALASSIDLIEALIDQGYLPVRGPLPVSPRGYLRLADGRFEVIYGHRLDARMAATRFEKRLLEGSDPPQLQDYVVRGSWYELGSEKPEDVCPQSREGYPLWGSFAMYMPPWGTRARLTFKRCADADDETVPSEDRALNNLMHSRFREFGLDPVNFPEVLGAELATMNLQARTHDAGAYAAIREPLYQSDLLSIYPNRPDLCAHRRLDAVYRVNSEARDRTFGGNYRKAIGPQARDVIRQRCGDVMTVSVRNFAAGDADYWDRMSFQLKRDRPLAFGADQDRYLELLDHTKSARAKAHDAWLAANHLGPACEGAPFCELPGGRYLNAVYRGDLAAIRQMDHILKEEISGFVGGSMPDDPAGNPLAALFGAALEAEPPQLLKTATHKYLYSYPAWGSDCLDPGYSTRTFEYTEPVVIETDEWGVTTRSGGEHYEATYTVNADFVPLRDRLGNAYGAPHSERALMARSQRLVYRGIVAMKEHYGCRSAEVKPFERNLIALTNTVLADPGTMPPADEARPPTVQLVRLTTPPGPQPGRKPAATAQVAAAAPPALPAVTAPAVTLPQAAAGGLSEAEAAGTPQRSSAPPAAPTGLRPGAHGHRETAARQRGDESREPGIHHGHERTGPELSGRHAQCDQRRGTPGRDPRLPAATRRPADTRQKGDSAHTRAVPVTGQARDRASRGPLSAAPAPPAFPPRARPACARSSGWGPCRSSSSAGSADWPALRCCSSPGCRPPESRR